MNSQQLLEQLKSRKSHGGKKGVSFWDSMVSALPSVSIISKETRLAYLS